MAHIAGQNDSVARSPSRWRLIAALGALGGVTLLGFTAPLLPSDLAQALTPWLDAIRHNAWAPLAAIVAFAVLATVGVPQIVLITALVAVFGPWTGFFFSWTGKLIACAIGFAIGRRFGARLVAQHSSAQITALMAQLARRGFLASALIRLAPTVPSVLINIAAGATPMRFRDFLAGAALGSVPKMALLAFGSHAAMAVLRQSSLWAWGLLALVLVLWAVLAFVGKRWLRGGRS